MVRVDQMVWLLSLLKRGTIGKPRFSVNMYSGFQQVSQKVDMMDAYELANFIDLGFQNEWMRSNIGKSLPTDPSEYKVPDLIIPYIEGVFGLTNTDWQDEIFRNAMMSNYEISASGGNEKIKYFVSGNYLDQEGIIISSDYKRVSLRLNLDAVLTHFTTTNQAFTGLTRNFF